MAKQRATLSAIERLHGKIAEVLYECLEEREEITEMSMDEDGMVQETATGRTKPALQPAMMAQAINFVKQQGVYADLQGDKNTDKLAGLLDKNVKRSRLKDPKVASMEDHKQKQA